MLLRDALDVRQICLWIWGLETVQETVQEFAVSLKRYFPNLTFKNYGNKIICSKLWRLDILYCWSFGQAEE